MNIHAAGSIHPAAMVALSLLAWQYCEWPANANPTGGTVAQGAATFSSSGSQFTVNATSANTAINWQSFNIGAGETTTFVEPSSTSVVWNNIGGGNPSSILGAINANGYVVLQNQSGFAVGGSAVINAHGLLLTTAASPVPALADEGTWSFNSLPPSARIINYGQINIAGGGSAFLIASDIENHGTISAPGGKIGLYAGETVLVSPSPDGRGLSAEVTLPQGSVDNEGKLIADAGVIATQAQTVNQNGLIQANSVQEVDGAIELVASDSVNLGAGSQLSAAGAGTGVSSGGSIIIKSGQTFSDQAGSAINVSGGAQGGDGGQVEVSAPQMGLIHSSITGRATAGFAGGRLTIDPTDITLDDNYANMLSGEISGGLTQINVQADDTIEVTAGWIMPDMASSGSVNLTAGNNFIMDDQSYIQAGHNCTLNITAGAALPNWTLPAAGIRNNGVYLDGDSYLSTYNGDLNVTAANEVLVNGGDGGGITTFAGGNINVTAQYGGVNTGNSTYGYDFGQAAAPYYGVDFLLGGISTAAGGNVTINAGGNVTSFLPVQTANPADYANALGDAGSGAFGPEPGNVTIKAGGNVYGNYVMANGTGLITAGGDVGAPSSVMASDPTMGFALSLVKGGWTVNAPNGNIYVQDIRNPNGIFGEAPGLSEGNYAGYHLFDYDQQASVSLNAANTVEFTGFEAPHSPDSYNNTAVIPFLLPPQLSVTAGAGGFILDTSVILFPSPYQNLNITTVNSGNFGIPNSLDPYSSSPVTLEMSGSASTQWLDQNSFLPSDQSATMSQPLDLTPVNIHIAGNMDAVNLYVTKAANLSVGGNMINSGFIGVNWTANETTAINVTGDIYNSPVYTFASLGAPIVSANPLQPAAWDSLFNLALNPATLGALSGLDARNVGPNGLSYYLKQNNYLLFPSSLNSSSTYGLNPGFVYDPASLQLGFKGNMTDNLSAAQLAALEGGSFTVLVADSAGNPIIDASGHLETTTYTFSPASQIARLDSESQSTVVLPGPGYQIGGPGQFDVNAEAIDLGNTAGIGSDGFGRSGLEAGGFDYSFLSPLLPDAASGGAAVTVQVGDKLTMATSGIYSRDGGDVTVTAGITFNPDGSIASLNPNAEIDLSQGSFVFPTADCYGIYTSGHSDVTVYAGGNINIGSARIATFDGGNVNVESYAGSVDAGTGANTVLDVYGYYVGANGMPTFAQFGDFTDQHSLALNPAPYGSGVLAEYPAAKVQAPGGAGQPGNITITTPKGNITSSVGGISQFALDQTISGNPSVTLIAGTTGVPATADQGNVLLGEGGVVGGTVNITAGHIQGLVVSRQNANINAAESFSGTVLSGGSANFVGAGSVSGTVVGIGGISVAGGATVSATLLSQNVSVGATTSSTLGATATATAASQSAANQSGTQTQQQLASNSGNSDDQTKKKKPALMQHVKRVTVILPEKT